MDRNGGVDPTRMERMGHTHTHTHTAELGLKWTAM